uniref:ATP synthase subunit b, chloroplastic n=1 Tax=Taenioma perpusillum TaxID=210852 RepID=A0A1Z1MS09_9FLOR|nr:ATP synthase CF0 subunit I [Taenioma perpusillum]ARW68494.1 ATP synthase CF0 subunit I [Taenioma perpusillum]
MQIFNFISMDISFNSNFLEANVLNISLLLTGLIYVLKQFLGSSLSSRQEKVLLAISESEERLSQANIRLNESEKQLAQTQVIIEQILKEAEITAQKVSQSILEQGKSDIERLTASSKISINYAENKIKQQIQQEIVSLAINQVSIKLQNQMTSVMQSKIIDRNIIQLKGNLKI